MAEKNIIKFVFTEQNKLRKKPEQKTIGSAGYDVYSIEDVTIQGWTRVLVSTGLMLEINEGNYAELRARSGMSTKCIDIGAGIIDNDYRGEVKILLINNGSAEYKVNFGDSIAQLLFHKMKKIEFKEVANLSKTERGPNGFGSTNKKND
jgi:dUTP pyrophosphatase